MPLSERLSLAEDRNLQRNLALARALSLRDIGGTPPPVGAGAGASAGVGGAGVGAGAGGAGGAGGGVAAERSTVGHTPDAGPRPRKRRRKREHWATKVKQENRVTAVPFGAADTDEVRSHAGWVVQKCSRGGYRL